jgi:thiosulfate/3-mercaptopyruvate sulfurtransferase
MNLPGPLVAPDWLRAALGRPRLAVVDMRGAEAYAEGHVPGAARLDLADLGSKVEGQDNVLLPAPAFERLMARLGISNQHEVVAYDDQWGLAAARLLWALHAYGHRAVAVLNGGWDRWTAEGGPTDTATPAVLEAGFRAAPDPDVAADLAWIRAHVELGDVVLLDTRTPAEYQHGHLPGALAWDWFNAVPADSWDSTRDSAELRAEWRELGLEPTDEVAVYCRSGMRAAHTYLALKHAGFPRVRLYDGSWQEWSMHAEQHRGT